MLSAETLESARTWYETGVRRMSGESVGPALAYLERAIPVFAEAGTLRLLTLARHTRLLALKLEQRHEEAEAQFADTMRGYTELRDAYGQSLLLCHLAELQAAQGRWQRAHSLFNLAGVVAENDQQRAVAVHILWQQGQLCRQRDDLNHAVRQFQRAERLLERQEELDRLAQMRLLRAQALTALGEAAEAIALLEDVQTHLMRSKQNQAAIEPLTLLRGLYEEQGQLEERNRVAQLLHLSGQRMIQVDSLPRPIAHLGPPIDRELRA